MSYSSLILHLYCIISGGYALHMFIRNFLPLTDSAKTFSTYYDIPSHVGDERINVSELYENHVDKVVIMIIDAFRVDFIDHVNGVNNMPYTYSLLKKNEAFLVIGNVQTPTVTMPRIKAMTTGTVPNFVDIIYNLGSNNISEDNFIMQAESNGYSVIFYGDETWLKLFPDNFKRKEGTTSFFVADFTEVDENVTRNLNDELKVNDWNIMILHYLGLDHIGHLEGPRSANVRPKLLEMDFIVQKIHDYMMQWAINSSKRPILLICGDHGMKDSGGHGGATIAETTIPIIAVGLSSPYNKSSTVRSVFQIDLVPTLSVLLGLPIPKNNIGKLIPEYVEKMDVKNKLYALYYNSKQIAEHYYKIKSYDSTVYFLKYKEAVRLHMLWLQSNGLSTHNAAKAEELYISCLDGMSETLRMSRTAYDVGCLVMAICIECQLCIILVFRNKYMKHSTLQIYQMLLSTLIILFLNALVCLYSESETALCTFRVDSAMSTMLPIVIFAANFVIITNLCSSTFFFEVPNKIEVRWLFLGSGVHIVSLLSSSFIEEEHQVWYFIWLTFVLIIVWKECEYSYYCGNFKNPILYVALSIAVCHRILRKFNQTGDKWASLPDISDWLLDSHQKGFLTLVFALGLAINFIYLTYSNRIFSGQSKTFNMIDFILNLACFFAVYLYRASTGAVFKLFETIDSKGIEEAKVFWCVFFLMVMKQLVLSVSRGETNKMSLLGDIICLCVTLWMLITNLLHRPHNVLLPGIQGYASFFLGKLYQHTSKTKADTCWLTIVHCWLGMVFYFYQGNSNSLATVDVASGYVGLQDYDPVIVGIFLTVNTFSAPVFSLLLLGMQLFLEARKRSIHWFLDHMEVAFRTLICYRLSTISLYLILVVFQRFHLFVWTVFSPKLLYETMYTIVQFLCILFCSMIVVAVDKLSPSFSHKNNKRF